MSSKNVFLNYTLLIIAMMFLLIKIFFFGISMLTYFSLRRIGKDNSLRKNRNRLKSVRRSNHVVGVRILRQSYPLHNADNYDYT